MTTRRPSRHHSLSKYICSTLLSVSILTLANAPQVLAETFTAAEETRFSPSEGQPIFPAGNINVFKQFALTVDEAESIGKTVGIDFGFFSVEFGGDLSAGLDAAFGFEFGMCFGGNADFDLAFQPSVMLPDMYPTEVDLPLTVSEGFNPDSTFETTFPPLGTFYADLIFDIQAYFNARACVGGCVDFGFDFDICNLAPLIGPEPPIGTVNYVVQQLFKESVRCDPTLDEEAYCATELISFNRSGTNNLRYLNFKAQNLTEFIGMPYIEKSLAREVDIESAFGKLSFNIPTVDTTSAASGFNTSKALRSSGSEDVLGLSFDFLSFVSQILPVPLSESGSAGPLDWEYTLASLDIGPAIQLQTDFEMTWDLQVTEIAFTAGGTTNPVDVVIGGIEANKLSAAFPGRIFHLTNCGPNALPVVRLLTAFDNPNTVSVPQPPVDVKISYVVLPKLKTIVSLPVIGQAKFEALAAGVDISRVGDWGFGPLVQSTHKFKVGEFDVYESDPTSIDADSSQRGELNFTMQAAGPPSFAWDPETRIFNGGHPGYHWDTKFDPGNIIIFGGQPTLLTHWKELTLDQRAASYPSEPPLPPNGRSASTAMIETLPPGPFTADHYPMVRAPVNLMAYKVAPGAVTTINNPNTPAGITVWGGLIDNNGLIDITTQSGQRSYLGLDSANGVLCGTGEIKLSKFADLLASTQAGVIPTTVCNYNTVVGYGGKAFDARSGNPSAPFCLNNVGTFRADSGGDLSSDPLWFTSANEIINQGQFESVAHSEYLLRADLLETRAGSEILANGQDADLFLQADQIEHSGLILAKNSGLVQINNGLWNAGQSMSGEVGFFRAEGLNSKITFSNNELNGGCFFARDSGAIGISHSDFTGTVFHIGEYNPNGIDSLAGSLNLNGGSDMLFDSTCLSNYGTVTVDQQTAVTFSNNMVFANNGNFDVMGGSSVHIHAIMNDSPGVADETRIQPGLANAATDTLMGGTWNITGSLLIDGAEITSIGANDVQAITRSGSITGTNAAERVRTSSPEDDGSRLLGLGSPATLTLYGTDWDFPALAPLQENRGNFGLGNDARFPSDGSLSNGTVSNFTNLGVLYLFDSSTLYVGHRFIQSGADSYTSVDGASTIRSLTSDYTIRGGSFFASANSGVFSMFDDTIPAGTTLRVESPYIDDPMTNTPSNVEYVQERVTVNIARAITAIEVDASVTVHGAAVDFPSLESLRANAGVFTLSGGGYENPGRFGFEMFSGDRFINSGKLNVTGPNTQLDLNGGDLVQNGGAAVTRIGPESQILGPNVMINNGEIVVEIDNRPAENQRGNLRAQVEFNDRLVIDFTGLLAQSTKTVEIGDTWEIVSRFIGARNITGTNFTVRVGGSAMPSNWLPDGSKLEGFNYKRDGLTLGFGIRVVPINGYFTYTEWADSIGLPSGSGRNPFSDANSNGISNAEEYLYGEAEPANPFPGHFDNQQFVTLVDTQSYSQVSYMRPTGDQRRETAYTPYYSYDMTNWYVAPMLSEVSAGPNPSLERVTLETVYPAIGQKMFFRLQADLRVDPNDFPQGTFADNPLQAQGSQNNVGYEVGQIVYFDVRGDTDNGTVYGTDIYLDWADIGGAAVHAGVLDHEERGTIRVTFLPRMERYTASTRFSGTNNEIESQDWNGTVPASSLSYVIEAVDE